MSSSVTPGSSVGSTPVGQSRATTVILQASSSGSSSGQSPTKPIPAPLQLSSPGPVAAAQPVAATPSNVVLIRPAPVFSPTSRSAPGGGFFIHTGTVSNGPSPVVPSTAQQPTAAAGSSTVTIQPPQLQQKQVGVVSQQNAAAPVPAVSSEAAPAVRSSFSIVSAAAPQPPKPPAPPQAVVTAPLLPHEHITTLVKTADVTRFDVDIVDALATPPAAVIRPPSAKSVAKKGPPPMTPCELLSKADPMWVCGFALAVMAIAFAAMANEGEIPLTYILSGVVFTSLAAFVKLRL
jgi:hypothetical protein